MQNYKSLACPVWAVKGMGLKRGLEFTNRRKPVQDICISQKVNEKEEYPLLMQKSILLLLPAMVMTGYLEELSLEATV